MKTLFSKYFFFCFSTYLLIQLLRKLELIGTGWVNNYLNDLLCMPVVLVILLWSIRKIKKNTQIILPWYTVFLTVIYWSVYFEWYLPAKSAIYTADVLDVVMYAIGAATYWVWQLITFKKPEHQVYYQ